jgi:hypothetical protein
MTPILVLVGLVLISLLLWEDRRRATPKRLYVVMGDPWDSFKEPPYNTDPRSYKITLFKELVSDEQFERDYRHKVKAFIRREDAITFAYHCNLVNVMCPVYDRVDGQWVYNKDETGKVAADIN